MGTDTLLQQIDATETMQILGVRNSRNPIAGQDDNLVNILSEVAAELGVHPAPRLIIHEGESYAVAHVPIPIDLCVEN